MKDLVKHLSDSQRKCHHYSSFLAESHIPQCQSQSNSEVLYRKHVVNSSAREYERQRQIRSSVRKVTGAGGGNARGRQECPRECETRSEYVHCIQGAENGRGGVLTCRGLNAVRGGMLPL